MAEDWREQRGFKESGVPMADLIQEGLIVLFELHSEFDETKGKLSAYARRALYEAWQELARIFLHPVTYPISAYFSLEGNEKKQVAWDRARKRSGPCTDRVVVLSCSSSAPPCPDRKKWVLKGLEAIGNRSRKLLIQNYGLCGCEEWPLKWLAIKRGVSRTTMHKYRDQALDELCLELRETAWIYN